ncbi:hypothetical protein, partial [Serratia marcescens]|uniref:hypothetical protein n=1 Tax=Serratia marcescens TaxID=615 RepID=UPI00351392ED
IMPRAWESSILRVHDDAMDPFYSNYRIGQLILKRSALRVTRPLLTDIERRYTVLYSASA